MSDKYIFEKNVYKSNQRIGFCMDNLSVLSILMIKNGDN